MSYNEHIKLLTFDLDNTLWSVRQVISNAERTMRDWLAVEVPGFNERFERIDYMRLREALMPEHPQIRHDLTEMRRIILLAALREFGQSEVQADLTARAATEQFLIGRHQVEFFPHARETLQALARHYTLAALSNGNADVRRLGLGDWFAFSCGAAEIGASKPMPDMFHAALERAGVSAKQAVHIGDHPIDDIQGASNIGMHTVLVTLPDVAPHPGAVDQPAEPTAEVSALRELPEVIRTLPTGR